MYFYVSFLNNSIQMISTSSIDPRETDSTESDKSLIGIQSYSACCQALISFELTIQISVNEQSTGRKSRQFTGTLCADVLQAHTPKTVKFKMFLFLSPLLLSICTHKARLVDKSDCTTHLGRSVHIDHLTVFEGRCTARSLRPNFPSRSVEKVNI